VRIIEAGTTRRGILAAGLAFSLPAQAAPARPVSKRPSRVISLFPCIDAILLRVANPHQIAGLSNLSHEPEVSSVAADALPYPRVRDDAESLLAYRPDLVVVSRYTASPTLRALRRAGVQALVIDPQLSAAESLDQVRRVAKAVGYPERGDALAARITGALERAAPRNAARPGVLVFQTGGFVAGTHTLIDDMLNRTGFSNLAPRYGVRDFGDVALEKLVKDPPQLLLAGVPRAGQPGWGERVLRHPALLALKGRTRIEPFPQSLLLCGGPVLLQTAPKLAAIHARLTGGDA
jgi:iron complex transport system substrate-binding protein